MLSRTCAPILTFLRSKIMAWGRGWRQCTCVLCILGLHI